MQYQLDLYKKYTLKYSSWRATIIKQLPTDSKNSIIMENQQAPQQQVFIQQAPAPKSNGIGTAGFVLALIGLILCWIPILDWILWLLGVIFSFIGVFRAPRGLAIAGLVISFIGIIILIAFIGAIAAML